MISKTSDITSEIVNIVKFKGSPRDQAFKVFSFPVKFGKKYKLYCESSSAENKLQFGFYCNNKLMSINESILDTWATNLGVKTPRLSFASAYTFEVPNANKELRPFEKYLRAFV